MTEFEQPEPIDPDELAAKYHMQADIAGEIAGYALDKGKAEAVTIAREMERQDRIAAKALGFTVVENNLNLHAVIPPPVPAR